MRRANYFAFLSSTQPQFRLYSVYSMEAERLKKLSETVLNYFNKDNLNFTLQVSQKILNLDWKIL